jgi:hypothetical protein
VVLAKIMVCALSTASLATLALGATSRAVFASPQRYYLALGDSIAYGIQPAKVRAGTAVRVRHRLRRRPRGSTSSATQPTGASRARAGDPWVRSRRVYSLDEAWLSDF